MEEENWLPQVILWPLGVHPHRHLPTHGCILHNLVLDPWGGLRGNEEKQAQTGNLGLGGLSSSDGDAAITTQHPGPSAHVSHTGQEQGLTSLTGAGQVAVIQEEEAAAASLCTHCQHLHPDQRRISLPCPWVWDTGALVHNTHSLRTSSTPYVSTQVRPSSASHTPQKRSNFECNFKN